MPIITSGPMADAPAWPADIRDSDFLPAPLARLLATARREVDGPTDDHGLCTRALAPVPRALSHQGQATPGEWPLCSFLELGALAGAVPCGRLHACPAGGLGMGPGRAG